jgi:hypothetical protein
MPAARPRPRPRSRCWTSRRRSPNPSRGRSSGKACRQRRPRRRLSAPSRQMRRGPRHRGLRHRGLMRGTTAMPGRPETSIRHRSLPCCRVRMDFGPASCSRKSSGRRFRCETIVSGEPFLDRAAFQRSDEGTPSCLIFPSKNPSNSRVFAIRSRCAVSTTAT